MADTPRGAHIAALQKAIASSRRATTAAQEAAAQIAAEREEERIRLTNEQALTAGMDAP